MLAPPLALRLPSGCWGDRGSLTVEAIGFGDGHLCLYRSVVLITERPRMGTKPLNLALPPAGSKMGWKEAWPRGLLGAAFLRGCWPCERTDQGGVQQGGSKAPEPLPCLEMLEKGPLEARLSWDGAEILELGGVSGPGTPRCSPWGGQ